MDRQTQEQQQWPADIYIIVFQRESELLYDWQFAANHFILVPSPLRPTTTIFFN
jgi:hypothetical protein